MNKFKQSIINNETKAFLLGRGQYFVRDLDRGGHDNTDTYSQILMYLNEFGESEGYELLDNSISQILESEFLSPNDLMQLIGIIWSYYVNRKLENRLSKDWHVSDRLKSNFVSQIHKHEELNSEVSDIKLRLNMLKSRFEFSLDSEPS